MLKILSLDTSTAACSVALAVGDEVRQRHAVAPRQHAQLILPWIESLLAEAGLTLHQLDAIAVGRGPGGFTGIRIGVGVVQGLAFGAGLPVVPVSSLQLIAQTAKEHYGTEHVLVAQDARMNEVYWAAYSCDENGLMVPVTEEQLSLPIAVEVPSRGVAWCPVGDAWSVYSQVLAAHLKEMRLEARCELLPEARYLSPIAADLLTRGAIVAPEQALPIYLRGKEAWTKKQN